MISQKEANKILGRVYHFRELQHKKKCDNCCHCYQQHNGDFCFDKYRCKLHDFVIGVDPTKYICDDWEESL